MDATSEDDLPSYGSSDCEHSCSSCCGHDVYVCAAGVAPPIAHLWSARGSAGELYQDRPELVRHLTDDQVNAVSAVARDPCRVFDYVQAQLKRWRVRKQVLAERVRVWRSQLCVSQLHVLGRFDPFLLQELLAEAGHVDWSYVDDLMSGFPISGVLSVGGVGIDVPGGLRCKSATPNTCLPSLRDLQSRCSEINRETIARARNRVPMTHEDWLLAEEVWKQTEKDIAEGRAGAPISLHEVDLSEVLLVDSFGIWEQHGDASTKKARTIRNFRANLVNNCALMTQKMVYDGFPQLLAALAIMAGELQGLAVPNSIVLGKTDFKSAFKTLPFPSNQSWMCWALVFQPMMSDWVVVPLWSHVFGNVGGVHWLVPYGPRAAEYFVVSVLPPLVFLCG